MAFFLPLNNKYKIKFLLLLLVSLLGQLTIFFTIPQKTYAGSLTSVSATLGNSRLSFFGRTNGIHAAGVSTIALQNSGNADNNANNIFPSDALAVGINGGLSVASRSADLQSIILNQPLTVTVPNGNEIYASQSGSLTIAFTLANQIPLNGYIYISIPAPASGGNDKAPETNTTTDLNGFDANGITASDITTAGGTGCTWSGGTSGGTWTASNAGGYHTWKHVTTSACTGGTITVTIDSSPGLMNPAPVTTGHNQGTADNYQLLMATYDSGDQIIDNAKTLVAPVEGVFVSTTIADMISFTVAGVNTGTSTCGQTTSVTTTATAVPFGTLSPPNVATASQKLTVSTNAKSYVVTIEESGALSIDGLAGTTIADTICDLGVCSHSASGEWKTGYNPAKGLFGYALANVSGADAAFLYNESSRVFSSKQLPTTVDGVQNVMTQSSPVNASSVYVCYMLAFQATQQAGYYWNKVKYTATPTF